MGSKSKQEEKEISKKHRKDSSSVAEIVTKRKKKHKQDDDRNEEAPSELATKKSKVEQVPARKSKLDLGSLETKKRNVNALEKSHSKTSKSSAPNKSEKRKKRYSESSDSDSSSVPSKKSPIKLPVPNLSSLDSDFASSEDERITKKKKNDQILSSDKKGHTPQITSGRKSILSSDKLLSHSKKKQTVVDPEVSSYEDEEEEEINEKSLSPPKFEFVSVGNDGKTDEHEECKVTADSGYEGWSKDDLLELFKRMEVAIPKNDIHKYNSRVEKLDWEQIKFNDYTAAECKEKWKLIEKKVRGYRLLIEMVSDAKAWVEKPWTDFYRSSKKNRHPDLPKRPLTSFMLFYIEKKQKYAKKNPGLEMTRLSKIVAEKYKNLSPKKKEKYNQMAAEMREEYKEKLQKFVQEHPTEALRKSNKAQHTKKDEGMPGPAKPVPPSKLYLMDKIRQHKSDPNFNLAEFTIECRNKWKGMTSKKKIPWIRWAHDKEMAYLEELKYYKSENPSFEIPPFKSVLSKKEKMILARMEGKPEKPPHSAYSLFSRTMLKDKQFAKKFYTPKEKMQEIARLWKEVPKADKDMYAQEVKRLIENYKMEYATYLDSLSEDKLKEELASNVRKRKAKVESDAVETKDKLKQEIEKGSPVKLDFLAKEPPQPPSEPFVLFCKKYKKLKPNREFDEKKARKAWKLLDENEKEEYETELENMKQQYFIDYREFLMSLTPNELKAYSECKGNPGSKKVDPVSNSEAGSDSDEDDDDEEEEEDPLIVKPKEETFKQISVDSSSSSSSSSSDESDSF